MADVHVETEGFQGAKRLRRAERGDIINAWQLDKMLSFFEFEEVLHSNWNPNT